MENGTATMHRYTDQRKAAKLPIREEPWPICPVVLLCVLPGEN